MTHRSRRIVPLALGAVLLVAGCSSSPASTTPAAGAYARPSSSASASTTTAAAAGPTMDISNFTFSTITVKPGATVTVTNADGATHTVNVNGTQIDVTVPGGGQATFTAPTKPGSYPLTCDFHRSMHGVLTVSA